MTNDEAKRWAEGNIRPGCKCEECEINRIALWMLRREDLVRDLLAPNGSYKEWLGRLIALETWEAENPRPT